MAHSDQVYELFKSTPGPDALDDYWHVFNASNCLRTHYWGSFFEMAREVDGAIIECGVGRGRSLIPIIALETLYQRLDQRATKKIYALDSFEGFPEPHEFDMGTRRPKKGEWSVSPNNQFKYSPEALETILRCAGLGDEALASLQIVPGFFSETLPTLEIDRISILHLDGDLYESVKEPLDLLWDKVSVGGVIVIDDFILNTENPDQEKWPGARRAVGEFMRDTNNGAFVLKESVRGTPYLLRV